jgi:hypothetical protein
LTGARTSGGACGSIRRNAKNLTWARTALDHLWKQSCVATPLKRKHSQETASDKLEEGGDDVKSSWPLCPGLHTCYNGRYKPLQTREGELIGKNRSQFGSQAATRLREAGIASNGVSE